MKYVKLFENFLNEEIEVPIIGDASSIAVATKKSLIASGYKVKGKNFPGLFIVPGIVRKFSGLGNKVEYEKGKWVMFFPNFEKICILVLANHDASEFIEQNFVGGSGAKNKKTYSIFSKSRPTRAEYDDQYVREENPAIPEWENAYLVEYSAEPSSESESFSFEKVFELPEYQKFLEDSGTVLISTKTQLKNGTLVFALPAEFAVNLASERNSEWEYQTGEEKEKYMLDAISMTSTGYIRLVGSWRGIRAQVKGKFNGATEKGWKEGFKSATDVWNKIVEKWKREKIEIFRSEEERHNKRGYISGKKFGF